MSLQFANYKRYLFAEQTSRGNDPLDDQLKATGNTFTFQDVRDLTITPQAMNDPPDRETWSASGHRAPFVKNKAEFEAELPLTAGEGSTAQPLYHAMLKAMNLEEDTSTSNEAVYTPSTTPVSVASVYQYIRNVEDNQSRLRVLTDIMASAELSISTGEEAMMSVSGAGYYNSITQPANFIDSSGEVALAKDGSTDVSGNSHTYELADKNPLIPKNMVVTIDGPQFGSAQTFDISEFTLDLNWTQDMVDALTNAEGEMDHYNTRGTTDSATGGFTLLRADADDFDNLISSYEAADQLNIHIELHDVTTPSDKIIIDIPKAQLGVESEGENGNLMQHEFEFQCRRDPASSLVGDNDFSITYQT